MTSAAGRGGSRVGQPKCVALGCRAQADYILVLANLLGHGDYVKRLCGPCYRARRGFGGGFEHIVALRVERWKKPGKTGYGYCNPWRRKP